MIGFWCGLCFVANGAYVGFGATDFIGDAGDIRRAGSPHALLMLFGLSCIAVGLISWHITAKTARAVPVDKRRPFLRSAILFAVSALIVVAVAAV